MTLAVSGPPSKTQKQKKASSRKKSYQKKPLAVSDEETERQIREYAKRKIKQKGECENK
jgi:hypothetical protein